MSDVVWSGALTPPPDAPVRDLVFDVYDPPWVVPRAQTLPRSGRALVELPDPRAYRSLSRTGLLLAAVSLGAAPALQPLARRDPYRFGIYCAVEKGPQEYAACRQLGVVPGDDYADRFKDLIRPKQYFQTLSNLAAAQLGIFLDARGPINVYNHSRWASLHALEQAELDLANGLVDAALACAAFSLDDPLLAERSRRRAVDGEILREGAAALLLVRGTTRSPAAAARSRYHYGLAQEMIAAAEMEDDG